MNGFLQKIKLQALRLDAKKMILLSIAMFFIFYLDYKYILEPQFKDLSSVRLRLKNTKRNIETFQKEFITMRELKEKQDSAGEEQAAQTKKMISSDQIPLLLKEISDISNRNQVRITQIKPSGQPRDAARGQKPQKFNTELITLEMSCDYHHCGQFLNELENTETLLTLEEMKISSNPKEYFRQDVRLVIKAYVKE